MRATRTPLHWTHGGGGGQQGLHNTRPAEVGADNKESLTLDPRSGADNKDSLTLDPRRGVDNKDSLTLDPWRRADNKDSLTLDARRWGRTTRSP